MVVHVMGTSWQRCMAANIALISLIQEAKNQCSPKLTGASAALSSIKDGSIVAISGFNMPTTPEYMIMNQIV